MIENPENIGVHVGQVVITPAGRAAVVRAVDVKRREATVEALPWGAAFKVEHLRPAAGIVFLDMTPRVEPEGER